MATFQGKRVSKKWKLVLEWAKEEGVRFLLNSGQRTMAEQRALYNLYLSGRGNLAAKPNPWAPHIRVGFPHHALDINSLDGGETRLERWVESKGVDWKNAVAGESWHGEVSLAGLNKLYRQAKAYFKRWKGYTATEKRWIKEYDRLGRSKRDADRRRVLKRVMAERRKRIWREAENEKNGWKKNNRRARYESLLARSR